jgi:hypothetical protein
VAGQLPRRSFTSHLAHATIQRYLTRMTDPKPPGPFTLTRPRIVLLVLGAIAVTYIVGALMGGVANYQELRNARDAALTSSEAVSSPS